VPSLTDGEIRRALKQVEQTGKQLSLVDGEGHGTGRLVLVMKPMPTRVTADWMAQQWRDQKRLKKKLGSYPSMSLSKAREVFTRDFADMIQKGRSIKIAGDTRPGTVADLFEAYVAHLKASGKSSWKEAEKGLNKIADTLGRNRPARDIEPDEITDLIRPIYDRGKRSMADHVRSYIRSAYSWGLKSEHDYRSASQRRFRLVYNPAAGIPTEPKNVGTRWLDEEEFMRLYRWLECPDAPVHPPYTRAVRILMLTGQRVEEIARLAAECRVGGMLGGKAGVLHLHLGDGHRKLEMLFRLIKETEIPPTQVIPTHVNRNPQLLEEGIAFVNQGGYVDLTAGIDPEPKDNSETSIAAAIHLFLEKKVPLTHITISSDSNGSLPVFNQRGNLIGLTIATQKSLLENFRYLIKKNILSLEDALKLFSANPALFYKLKQKGEIIEGKDADILLFDKDYNITDFFVNGRKMISEGRLVAKGTFSKP